MCTDVSIFAFAEMPGRNSGASRDRARQGGRVNEDRNHGGARVHGQGDKRPSDGGPSGTPAKRRREVNPSRDMPPPPPPPVRPSPQRVIIDRAETRGGASSSRPAGSAKESAASAFNKYIAPNLPSLPRGPPPSSSSSSYEHMMEGMLQVSF